MPKSNKFAGIRLAVGLIVLTVLLVRLDLASLFEAIRRSSGWILGLAFLIMGLRLLIGARRWRLACSAFVESAFFWPLFAWYMEATFFNIFVPSQGGDLARVLRLTARNEDGALAMSTVVAERVLGLVAMIFLAGVGLLFSSHGTRIPGIKLSFWLAATATAIILAALFHPAGGRIVVRVIKMLKWVKGAEFVKRCTFVFAELAQRPRVLLGIFIYGVAMQLTGITAVYLIGLAISIPVPFAFYLVEVPIVWLVVMIPVSLNGIGTREGANVVLLTAVGVPAESALLLSVIWSSQLLLLGLIGGIFHLWLTATETKLKAGTPVP